MMLTESELHMTELIQQARVPVKKIQMNKSKNQPLQQKLAQQIAQDPALKHMAQKAFVSYMRSVHLQSNKKVFDINQYSSQDIAESWGLATLPRLRFVDVPEQKTKNIPYALREDSGGDKGDKGAAAWREAEAAAAGGAEKGKKSKKAEKAEKGEKCQKAQVKNTTQGMLQHKVKGTHSQNDESQCESESDDSDAEGQGGQRRAIASTQPLSKMTKLFNRKNHDVLSDTYRKMVQDKVSVQSRDYLQPEASLQAVLLALLHCVCAPSFVARC